jgi:hypothetical protein
MHTFTNEETMTAIWPGHEDYEAVMEAAKEEYEVWLNRNKTDFVIAKKAEKVAKVEDFEDDFDPYNPEMDGWSEKDCEGEVNFS